MQILNDGAYSISDNVDIPGEGISQFVFCGGWLLEIMDIRSGEFYFFRDGEAVRPRTKRFGNFYPPFSIISPYVNYLKGKVQGVGAIGQLDGLPKHPITFETDFRGEFVSAMQASSIISNAKNIRSIEINSDPSLLTLRAKRLIDENYKIYPSISRVAARVRVSHEHLTRQFKRDLQMTPSKYLHHLRVADATFRLSMGEEIVDISQDVGYNDLSRFYKQFRKKTATSPGVCRTILGPRA
ncbi:MAG: helix-turn-helix domain-containing protein [Pyrinomonadaceae bacterium]